ncbi:MAG: bacillithiol biosynthesis cysteine-adding enzyme BshC [Vicinamibacterales bacterium]
MSATSARLPVDIRRFPWINRLAADYAFDFARLAEFYAGNPAEPAAWRDAIVRTQQYTRQRDAVAGVLAAQQQHRGAPAEAAASAARLRDPRSVAVVTGQQAGLFGGPLFTLLKAITTIRLAERVRLEHRVPAIPIFWIDSEDHDWAEVKSCGVLDAELNLLRIAVSDPPGANERSVARTRLDDSARAAIERLESTLPRTEFTPDLLTELRTVYRPGAGMAHAFGQWLETILGSKGLVVFDAADPAAKPIVASLFRQEIEHAGRTSALAGGAGAELAARGYRPQVTPYEGQPALFHLDGGREPVRQQDGVFTIGRQSFSRDALFDLVTRTPQAFSPNVLLRPLVQDTLFPTVCYVAGPSELAYLGQLRGVYAAFGLPMPLMQQRATATLLDANSMRFLTRHDFAPEHLRAQDEAALNQLLEAQLPASVEASLEDAARVLVERMEALAEAVPQIDPTLEGAARSTLSRMQDDLKKLHGKIIQAAKRKDETLRRQFRHARAQAFPDGHPQERTIGFVYFLNKYGPALVDRLSDELTLEMGTHWILTI